MRNINKKIDMAQKKNTRVVYCNTPEAQIMLDLASNIDKLYKHIRKNAGVSISPEKAELYRRQYVHVAMNLENFLKKTSADIGLGSMKTSFFLEQIMENSKGE